MTLTSNMKAALAMAGVFSGGVIPADTHRQTLAGLVARNLVDASGALTREGWAAAADLEDMVKIPPADCPNMEWHGSAPARASQKCPECPQEALETTETTVEAQVPANPSKALTEALSAPSEADAQTTSDATTNARNLDLNALNLSSGLHESPEQGFCLLEAVAFVAGEPHSDHPACVSPALGTFGRILNDRLPDAKRQQLKPLIPQLPGTVDDGLDGLRGYLALDWTIRVYAPACLDLAGLNVEAEELRALCRIVDLASAKEAMDLGMTVREKVCAKRSSAEFTIQASGLIARQDVRAELWDTWAAARLVAGRAAEAAVGDVGAASRTAKWVKIRAAVWGVWEAARIVAGEATEAASVASRAALQSTVDQLQDSSIDLFARMIRPTADVA